METVLFTLSAISIFCAPMRGGVYSADTAKPYIEQCEKKIWTCLDKTRKEIAKPTSMQLEKCFR